MLNRYLAILLQICFVLLTSGCSEEQSVELPEASVQPGGDSTSLASSIPAPASPSTPPASPPTPPTSRPTSTQVPDPTSSSEHLLVAPLDSQQEPGSARFQSVVTFPGENVKWSPVSNELVFTDCTSKTASVVGSDQFLYYASEPNFKSEGILTPNITCTPFTRITWRPDGKDVYFLAIPTSYDSSEYLPQDMTNLFGLRLNDGTIYEYDAESRRFDFYGWMDNDQLVKTDYISGGTWIVSIFDIALGEEVASAPVWGNLPVHVDPEYVSVDSGPPGSWVTAAVFSTIPVREVQHDETMYIDPRANSPYIKQLSIDVEDSLQYDFNSSFEDWIDDASNMLVLTWDAGEHLSSDVLHGIPSTDLQIWNVDTDELNLLVKDAVNGQFSPDYHDLVYIMPATGVPMLTILDLVENSPIYSSDIYVSVDDFTGNISLYYSFSPDSKYLAYLSSSDTLIIYDIVDHSIQSELKASPAEALWSPKSDMFLYMDMHFGLSIYDLKQLASFPLNDIGAAQLSAAQWSFDGSYVSILASDLDGETESVILRVSRN